MLDVEVLDRTCAVDVRGALLVAPLVRETTADQQRRADLLATVPLGRPGTAEDVAAMVLLLASDESAWRAAPSAARLGAWT